MSLELSKIIDRMEKIAEPDLAESWDNVGLLVGDYYKKTDNILIALDVTDKVIDEAVENNIDLIITHHPVIFKPMNRINSLTKQGQRMLRLIENKIAVYSAHTNLDIADGGTNSTLADLLCLKDLENLCEENEKGSALGKIGVLEKEMDFIEFSQYVKEKLGISHFVCVGNRNITVKKVGVGTGKCSGCEYMQLAKEKGCDVYITGDVGYHDGQNAIDLDLTVIDATHYETENIIVPVLRDKLLEDKEIKEKVNIILSKVDAQTLNII